MQVNVGMRFRYASDALEGKVNFRSSGFLDGGDGDQQK